MKNLTFYFLMLLAATGFAQNSPINFEAGGHGANWTWAVFENATNPPLEIIANPDPSGINTSATVAKFTALAAGNPWAGCESMHGADLGPFVLGPSNSIIKIMVWKSVISDVGIKMASPAGWAQVEIKRPNTVVNQWEELTFDFSNYVNPPADQGQLDQIIVFPDFNLAGRGQDNIIYFDNITFSAGAAPTVPLTAAPTPPARNAADVVSVFSGAYAQVPGTDFNPNWGQSTVVATIDIQGNPTLRYANFNYQGTQFAQPLNVSAMEKLHIDMWTANATSVNVFCISPGPVETAFSLPVTPGQWGSYDIPLTAFANVNLSDVIQFKFDGGNGSPTIYLDNLYFYKGASTGGADPNAPINFEPGGFGANWTWTVFENATNPPLEIIANPDPSGINTSATVAKFTALAGGNPWAGVESMHGADLGPFVLGPTNSTIKIMVWKSVISDVGIKFASPAGWAQVEIKRPNTVVNQWEELTFDFSNYVNPPADLGQLDQIIVFPDFNLAGRGQNNIIYFDNITFGPAGGGNPTVPMVAAPTPTRPASSVISLFSNAYTNVPVDTWRTGWSNAILEDIAIQGNATKKYSQLDFVGIETVANQIDATGMTHIHIDVWSADFTFFGFKLVDFGADGAFGGGDDVEHQVNYNLPQQGQWLSLDIPLSSFAGLTTRAHMAQYILVGQPTGANTIYVDNVYFYTNIVDTDEAEAFRNTVRVYPNPVAAGEQVQFSREVSQIEVFDLAGQRVLAGSGFRLNTAVLNPGVYVLKMRVQDGSIQTQKLVVK